MSALADKEGSDGPYDAIHRRRRTRPVSTGKRVTPQDRDIYWFEKLHQHGPLPSSFLLAFTRHLRRSEKRARERLTDLFNEENTPHGGAYLSRPPQQFRTIDSRYNQLVYDLSPASKASLQQADRWQEQGSLRSGPWLHSFMVSCITASIELGTTNRDDVSYIPQQRILDRAGADLRYGVVILDPATGRCVKKALIPDAIFGLEYHTKTGSLFRFFVLEADRATEPATSKNLDRKSFKRNLLQYREYVGRGRFQEHLRLTSPLLVLNVTTSQQRLEKMLSVSKALPDGAGPNYMLFQTCDAFGSVFRPPNPLEHLLSGPWKRAGQTDFLIVSP